MPVVEELQIRSITPEKNTRKPADSNTVKTLVSRVTKVENEAASSASLPAIRSNPELLRTQQRSSTAVKHMGNVAAWALETNYDVIGGSPIAIRNPIPFNTPLLTGTNGTAGTNGSPVTGFKFSPNCQRLGLYEVYFYLALEFASFPAVEQIVPVLLKNGTFYRAGDWLTASNSGSGTAITEAAIHFRCIVELSELTDYVEPQIDVLGGSQSLTWAAAPTSSVYGYIELTWLGCSDETVVTMSDYHPSV